MTPIGESLRRFGAGDIAEGEYGSAELDMLERGQVLCLPAGNDAGEYRLYDCPSG